MILKSLDIDDNQALIKGQPESPNDYPILMPIRSGHHQRCLRAAPKSSILSQQTLNSPAPNRNDKKMEISALASGSSGNCFYIEEDGKAVLIDAGISCKQIVGRLAGMKKNPENVKAIFITHEHSDHTKGADVFARNFKIPIFATKKTAKNCFLCSDDSLIRSIKNNETVSLNGLSVEAFSKPHLGEDPVSYNVINHKKISVITDVGYASQNIIDNVSDSDFLCIESNHDEMMLECGPYPYYLKKWIKGNYGHLSNLQASLCVLEHASSKLKNVILSHLSRTNNTPQMAFETFRQLVKERRDLSPKIFVSSRETPTPLIKV